MGTEWDEAKMEKLAISQQVLDKTFKDKVVGYCGGLITEAHRVWNERQKFTVGEIRLNPSHFISCQKGSKRTQGCDPPNQDNWSVTAFKSGWTLFFVHDGHGLYVSTRTVQTVPWYLIEDPMRYHGTVCIDKAWTDEDCIEQALLDAIEKSQADRGPGSLCSGEQEGHCRKRQHSTNCAVEIATKSGHRTLATADAWLGQSKGG